MQHNPSEASIIIRGIDSATVFSVVTDLGALSRWNDLIDEVFERPAVLEPGAVWKVALRDGPLRWNSRSVVTEYDPARGVFEHRSGTDDANPSFTVWRWSVESLGADTRLTVRWRLDPRTRARKLFIAPFRERRLRVEVPRSLARLADVVRADVPAIDRPLTLVGVWAHPDDESYLSAALMQRVAAAGGRVVVVTATWGEAGGGAPSRAEVARRRRGELQAALAALGVHEVHGLELPDGACAAADAPHAVARIGALLDAIGPDMVVTFAPDGLTGHDDHRAVSRWTLDAWQRNRHGRLLLATMTDDFVTRHAELHDRVGLAMGPPLVSVPAGRVALRVTPTAAERAAKRAALDAHASQTGPLCELLGYEAFHDWCVDETFREPTSDDFAWASPAPRRELVP